MSYLVVCSDSLLHSVLVYVACFLVALLQLQTEVLAASV
jgi:hypothetical protein